MIYTFDLIAQKADRLVKLPLLLASLTVSLVLAQSDRGVLRGVTTDSSGASVPGARLLLSNTATNVESTAHSSASGDFVIPALPPGSYRLRITKEGFKTALRDHITLTAGGEARVDITLEIGSLAESVQVTATAEQLQTANARVTTQVSNKYVDELPLVVGGGMRNAIDLAMITPEAKNSARTGVSDDNTFSLGGGQVAAFGITIDGVSVNIARFSSVSLVAVNTPSLDAITEFTVETNGYKAEFGRAQGGSMTFASKSGTNQLHGTAYEFIENGQPKKYPGHVTDITTDMALEFLSQPDPRPFCLIYQPKGPHRPFTPCPRHAKLFSEADLPLPANFNDDFATRKIAREAEDMRLDLSLAPDYPDLPKTLSPSERKHWIYQRFVKDMYRNVVGIDEGLGRVLAHLDKSGQANNTLIIYTSDNGFYLGEHGWYDKRFMYEPSLRVPLLIRYPRLVKPAQVSPGMVMNIDHAPTILAAAGLPVPTQMQGQSLLPVLTSKPPATWRTSIYYHYYENSWAERPTSAAQATDPTFAYLTPHRVTPHRGVRTSRYKLIDYYTDSGYKELFDLEADPNELNNIYNDPKNKAIIKKLDAELTRLRQQYKDTA